MATSAKTLLNGLIAKGYTPAQVLNSAERKEAWVRKQSTNPIEHNTWRKVKSLAVENLTAAYKEAGPGVIACDSHCMMALEDECKCPCGGVNHGIQAIKVA